MSRTQPTRNVYVPTQRKKEPVPVIETKVHPLTPIERKTLRSALLNAHQMQTLSQVTSPSLRMSLLRQKIHLCLVPINWRVPSDAIECRLIANKKRLLLELLDFYGQRRFKSLELLALSFRLIWLNLFRALPDPQSMRTSPGDDEMDFREAAWDHLVLVYEIAFHVVTNQHFDKKLMQQHLRGAFLSQLVALFKSLDDREPQYVKIILHAIYGRFMNLRRDTRALLSNHCFEYIYCLAPELVDSNSSLQWQGVPEILAILCSIIQGLNVPVKADYHLLLRNVLVPLHKTSHVDAFHEELMQCVTQFVVKDPSSVCVVLGGLLKFWPVRSPMKEQLFVDECVGVLAVSTEYIEQCVVAHRDRALSQCIVCLVRRLCRSMRSEHHQVAERALLVWREESVRLCLEVYGDECWPILLEGLRTVSEEYWLSDIRAIAKSVMAELQREYVEVREMCQMSGQGRGRSVSVRVRSVKGKEREREGRWKKVRELAVHRIEVNINK